MGEENWQREARSIRALPIPKETVTNRLRGYMAWCCPCRLPARERGRGGEPAAPAELAPAELAPGECSCSDRRRAVGIEDEARRKLARVSRMHTSAIWLEASERSRDRRSSRAS